MIKRFYLSVVALLLAACSAPANSNQPQTINPPTPLASAELPDVQCQGEIPAPVQVTLGDYRLARKSDFISAIRNFKPEFNDQNVTCAIFTADFNEDKLKDYALLLVHQKTFDFRFQMVLNQGSGKFASAFVKDYKRLTQPEVGVIYTSMSFKPPGAPGLAAREYTPLKPGTPERKAYQEKAAISLWKANLIPSGSSKDFNVNMLSYCSEGLYLKNGKETSFTVCD